MGMRSFNMYGASNFFRPRQVDAHVANYLNVIDLHDAESLIDREYRMEERRRRGTTRNGSNGIEDDFRNDFNKHVKPGEFSYSNIPMNDKPWQQLYWEYFSEYIPIGTGWKCKCGKKYLMGYPPYQCDWCRNLSPIGELHKAGAFKK